MSKEISQSKVKQMIQGLPKWGKPCAGKSLTLREWLLYAIGGMGAMGASVFLTYFTLTPGFYIANAITMDPYHLAIIGMITSVVSIATSPLVSWMIDNTNTKYGKFRPYLIILPIPIVACFIALGQVLRIADYGTMLIVYAVVFNIAFLLNRIYILAFTSLAQVMAPSAEERTQLMSIGSVFTSLGPTIATAAYPFISNMIYTKGDVDGVNTVATAQVLLPIVVAIFFAFGLIMAFGVKERMVVAKEYKQKQKFLDGIQKVAKNKYFWIHNSSAVFGIIKITASTTFLIWYLNFVISPELKAQGLGDLAAIMQSILILIIGTASLPGMIFAPAIIKKFGKKKAIIASNLGMALSLLPLTFIHNPWAGIFFIYCTTMCAGFQLVITPAFQAEINDYQQYKTGDRIEGFLSQFGGMIALSVGMATALIAPAVYKSQGYTGLDSQLMGENTDALYSIIAILSGVSLVSCILAAIPYIFWDLPDNKHEIIMEVLKTRALQDDGVISEDDRYMLEEKLEAGDLTALQEYIIENNIIIATEDEADAVALETGINELNNMSETMAGTGALPNTQNMGVMDSVVMGDSVLIDAEDDDADAEKDAEVDESITDNQVEDKTELDDTDAKAEDKSNEKLKH